MELLMNHIEFDEDKLSFRTIGEYFSPPTLSPLLPITLSPHHIQ